MGAGWGERDLGRKASSCREELTKASEELEEKAEEGMSFQMLVAEEGKKEFQGVSVLVGGTISFPGCPLDGPVLGFRVPSLG